MTKIKKPTRTSIQNRALHLYFELLAEALNDAGLEQSKDLIPNVNIPWNADSVKNQLWRRIQQHQLGKSSTTQLTTKEVDQVFNTLNRWLGESLGVHVPFPRDERKV